MRNGPPRRSWRRALPLIVALVLLVVIAAVSTLPTESKHALHTQGALHPWLHLCGFATLAFFMVSSARSDRLRVALVLALLLFGYATEAFESRMDTWPIEVKDVQNDCIGVLIGAVASLVRSPKNVD